MQIRPIIETDIAAVARLIRSLSEQFIVHESAPDAAAAFVREHDQDAVRRNIGAGMVYHVAESDAMLAGFIAVRDNTHLFHMFVDQRFHRQGVARALWEVARAAAVKGGNPGVITVNSSNFAVPVYEALGFIRTNVTQYSNGIYYNPMQWGRHHE